MKYYKGSLSLVKDACYSANHAAINKKYIVSRSSLYCPGPLVTITTDDGTSPEKYQSK